MLGSKKKENWLTLRKNLIKYVDIYPNVSHVVSSYFLSKYKFLKIQKFCSILNFILINYIIISNHFKMCSLLDGSFSSIINYKYYIYNHVHIFHLHVIKDSQRIIETLRFWDFFELKFFQNSTLLKLWMKLNNKFLSSKFFKS